MIFSFNNFLYAFYFIVGFISYFYLKNSYFPQFPSVFEKFIMFVLACIWVVSVPITFIMQQDRKSEEALYVAVSYDGFLGREA